MHERVEQMLRAAGVPYRVYVHQDLHSLIRGPWDVAEALGCDLDRITKTLLLRALGDEKYCVVVVSANAQVNFVQLSAHLGVRRVRLARAEELAEVLGYPPAGVSPIGAGSMPVFMDERLFEFDTILTGSGNVGEELELAPEALRALTHAVMLPLRLRA